MKLGRIEENVLLEKKANKIVLREFYTNLLGTVGVFPEGKQGFNFGQVCALRAFRSEKRLHRV